MSVYPYDGPYTTFTAGPQLSTDSWATLQEIDVQEFSNLHAYHENTNANSNSVDVRILGSIDGGDNYDITLLAAKTLTAGSNRDDAIPQAVSDVKVEIKAASGGSQDKVKSKIGAYNPNG